VVVQYRDAAVPANVRQLIDTITLTTLPGDDLVERWAGGDRYSTACTIARESFDSADVVVLATGAAFADALSASGLAGVYDAPLLLTSPTALPDVVRRTIVDLGADTVIIVGGPSAVSTEVQSAVDAIPGVGVQRIAGDDRYKTAAAVCDRVAQVAGPGFIKKAFVARGDAFADALAVSRSHTARAFPCSSRRPPRLRRPPARRSVGMGSLSASSRAGYRRCLQACKPRSTSCPA
jgi:hypothetical protein